MEELSLVQDQGNFGEKISHLREDNGNIYMVGWLLKKKKVVSLRRLRVLECVLGQTD